MAKSRTFVMGDIHGAYDALLQCLERAGFSAENDRLICLGDVADRRTGVRQCIDVLLHVNDLEYVMGNHDTWMRDWFMNRGDSDIWTRQGGRQTMESYAGGIPESHKKLFDYAVNYHTAQNRLFVHGGVQSDLPLNEQNPEDFLWDRTLVQEAWAHRHTSRTLTDYDEVFVGHTPTLNFPPEDGQTAGNTPLKLCNVWLMDTGAGWSGGRLTIMDVETKEFWQSDIQE